MLRPEKKFVWQTPVFVINTLEERQTLYALQTLLALLEIYVFKVGENGWDVAADHVWGETLDVKGFLLLV